MYRSSFAWRRRLSFSSLEPPGRRLCAPPRGGGVSSRHRRLRKPRKSLKIRKPRKPRKIRKTPRPQGPKAPRPQGPKAGAPSSAAALGDGVIAARGGDVEAAVRFARRCAAKLTRGGELCR
ncbi:hypothetical protein JD82_01965 [Prauserella rugosa]|uniref:Uncharacterized protein n=1 Tax=Prauserella rugosa TaxID=43354 RepID=A0A660CGT2_9PSEU|nr:hypothetical protein JD82_01965 [Prauserella rugosa]